MAPEGVTFLKEVTDEGLVRLEQAFRKDRVARQILRTQGASPAPCEPAAGMAEAASQAVPKAWPQGHTGWGRERRRLGRRTGSSAALR